MEKDSSLVEYDFQKLTPDHNAEMTGYEQALDFVFREDNTDVKNVAMTGLYGAGKSSVISTYEKRHTEKKFLHVSVTHFDGVEGEDDQHNYAVRLEEKIINQLIQQISPQRVPDSGFKIKREIKCNVKIWWVLKLLVLIISFSFFSAWMNMYELQEITVCRWLTNPVVTISIAIISILDIGFLLYPLIDVFFKKKKIRAFSFMAGSVDLDEKDESEKSYFDRHLDEILYLLVHSGADAIIFEDIDRFETVNLKVLEHLRELCILANYRFLYTDTQQQKHIKFFYLINDDVFLHNIERTKFFDYMIPIIPVVDSTNSYGKLKSYLIKIGDYEKFDDYFLRRVSLYLKDMRTLKNIVNEYQIYKTKVSKTAVDVNKLLALIVYKNQMPEDFATLQSGSGHIYNILDSKKNIIEIKTDEIEKKIKEKKEKLLRINNENLVSQKELDAVKADRYSNSNSKKYNDYSYDKWCSEIYNKRQEAINWKLEGQEKTLNEDIELLNKELSYLGTKHLHELIDENNEDIVFATLYEEKVEKPIEKENSHDSNGEKKEIKPSIKEDAPLIRFLVMNGYIDETSYQDYIAIFDENGMTLSDKSFLIGINSHEAKSYEYKIDNIDVVFQYITEDNFLSAEIRNYNLIDYILEQEKEKYVEKFVNQMREKMDFDFISKYFLKTENKGLFVRAMCMYWDGAILAMFSCENEKMSMLEIQDFVICCLANCSFDIISKQNKEDRLKKHIENEFDSAKCNAEDCNAIRSSLAVLKVKFENIEKQVSSEDLRESVYFSELYVLNKSNIYYILINYYHFTEEKIKGKEMTAIFSDENQPLFAYVKNNLNTVLKNILRENDEILDDKCVAKSIIEDETIDDGIKDEYLEMYRYQFDNLEEIDASQWDKVILYDVVEHTAKAIFIYFSHVGKELTNELVTFINGSVEPIDYSLASDVDEKLKELFWNNCRDCNDLDIDRYSEIVSQLGKEIVTLTNASIDAAKMKLLLASGLVRMDYRNLQFIHAYFCSLIPTYAESNQDEFFALAKNGLVSDEDKLAAIEHSSMDIEKKKELVGLVPHSISVKDGEYDKSIFEYIICNKFDMGDLPYLLENYTRYNNTVKEEIYNNLKKRLPDNIVIASKNENLMTKVFEDEGIPFGEKARALDLLLENRRIKDISFVLSIMKLENIAKVLLRRGGGRPQIKKGEKEIIILNVLKKHGCIKEYFIDESTSNVRIKK